MDYEWKPPLRGIGTILAREVGTSRGRGFATSERGTSAMPILSFRLSRPLPPGKGYLGAKVQSKATLVGRVDQRQCFAPFSRVDDQYTLWSMFC